MLFTVDIGRGMLHTEYEQLVILTAGWAVEVEGPTCLIVGPSQVKLYRPEARAQKRHLTQNTDAPVFVFLSERQTVCRLNQTEVSSE